MQGSVSLSTTESEDTWSLRQCTLLPSKFANVINLKKGMQVSVYLSNTECGDAWSLKALTLLPNTISNVMNLTQERRGQSTCLPQNQRILGL